MFDTRNTARLMLDPSAQCSGCPGDGAWFPLFLDQTEARRAENFFFMTGPFFSQGLDDPHPPHTAYLKAWICHCSVEVRKSHKPTKT